MKLSAWKGSMNHTFIVFIHTKNQNKLAFALLLHTRLPSFLNLLWDTCVTIWQTYCPSQIPCPAKNFSTSSLCCNQEIWLCSLSNQSRQSLLSCRKITSCGSSTSFPPDRLCAECLPNNSQIISMSVNECI